MGIGENEIIQAAHSMCSTVSLVIEREASYSHLSLLTHTVWPTGFQKLLTEDLRTMRYGLMKG